MKTKTAIACLAALICSAAGAQVYRCTDQATKKTTYSDAPCTDGKQIVRQRSAEDQLLDAERADIARQRFQREQEQQPRRDQQAAAPQSAPMQARADSHECKLAKHELSISSNIRTLSDRDKETRVNASIARVNAACGTNTELIQKPKRIENVSATEGPRPTNLTNCVGGICQDNTGGVYHRSGPDFMTGPGGKACHRAGNMWNCN